MILIIAIAFAAVMAIGSWRRTFFNLIGAGAYGVVWLMQNLFRITPPGWLMRLANWCGALGAGAWNAAQVALGVLSWVLIALAICIFAAISFGSEESLAIIMILLLGILMVIRSLVRAASYGASPLTARYPWLAAIDCGIQNTLYSACLGLIVVGTGALFLGDDMGNVITFRVFLLGILLVTLLGLSGWFNVGRGPGKFIPIVVIGMCLIMVLPTPIKNFAQGLGRHAGAALNSKSTTHQRGIAELETNARLTLAEVTEEATLYVASGDRAIATLTLKAGSQLACLNPQPSVTVYGREPMLEVALPDPSGDFVQLNTIGWIASRKVRLIGPITSIEANASGSAGVTSYLPAKNSTGWTFAVNIAMLLTGLAILAFLLTGLSLLISSSGERKSGLKIMGALAAVIIVGFVLVTLLADFAPTAQAASPAPVQAATTAQAATSLPATKTLPTAAAPVRAANALTSLVELADRYADQHRLERELVHSIIAVESAWDPRAVSSENAQGLMQLMPATQTRFGVKDAFDPESNIAAGTEYLRWLLDRYHGDVSTALIGYHSGEDEADKYIGKRLDRVLDQLKPRAKQYVPLVLGHWASLKSASGNTPRVAQARASPPNTSADPGSNHSYKLEAAKPPVTANLVFGSGQQFTIAVSGKIKRSIISPWVDCQGEDKLPRKEKDPSEFILPDERIMLPLAKIDGRWEPIGCSATFVGPATIEELWVNGRAHAPARYNMTALQRGELEFTITN